VLRPADLVTLLRLGLAIVLPVALARGGILPAVLWAVAAASDYVDGPLARRSGVATGRGMLLDNVADIAFVLGGLTTAAALGLVPWLVPAVILLAVIDYARASFEAHRGLAPVGVARSRIGHAAGVLNYACLGVVCARLAWPAVTPAGALMVVELATVVANMGAVAARVVGRMRPA
jgi:CDP-diacylglycerol--glycerol-3-phosphate 3-phosphatidyltransferase/cardiolipin synthase